MAISPELKATIWVLTGAPSKMLSENERISTCLCQKNVKGTKIYGDERPSARETEKIVQCIVKVSKKVIGKLLGPRGETKQILQDQLSALMRWQTMLDPCEFNISSDVEECELFHKLLVTASEADLQRLSPLNCVQNSPSTAWKMIQVFFLPHLL